MPVDLVILGLILILIILLSSIVFGRGPVIVNDSPRLYMVLGVLAALDSISEEEAKFINDELGFKVVPNSMSGVIEDIRNTRKIYAERLKQ